MSPVLLGDLLGLKDGLLLGDLLGFFDVGGMVIAMDKNSCVVGGMVIAMDKNSCVVGDKGASVPVMCITSDSNSTISFSRLVGWNKVADI